MDSPYIVGEFSQFGNYFGKVLKKYKRTFDDDFAIALEVVKTRITKYKGDRRFLPKTRVIAGLGQEVKHEILKMDIYIEEAKKYIGRLIFLIDKERKLIFLIDVYQKNDRGNHDVGIIKSAYTEYIQKYPLLP